MKVAELKEKLSAEFGMDPSELKGKSKAELTNILEQHLSANKTLEDAVPVQPTESIFSEAEAGELEASAEPIHLLPTSPDWSAYVMKQFVPNELEKNMPRVDALRRVAELLLGPYNTVVTIEQVPERANNNRATVVVELRFLSGRFHSAAADVCRDNADATFAVHPVAMAETRAEGRALRKALRLQRVYAAEELSENTQEQAELTSHKAPDEMIAGVTTMCVKLGINPFKLAITVNPNVSDLADLNMLEVRDMVKKINEYRNDNTTIPNNIKE